VAEKSPPRSFFTVEQLAKRWQVSGRTIRRKIKRGELHAMRIGPQLRVASDEVERFEARNGTGFEL
jgi:excisionase family DNA binding protein